jgi:hypothetical protein
MAKAITDVEETTECTQQDRRGTEDGTESKIRGANWGICPHQPIRDRRAKARWTKKIRHREVLTDSDEAIVSDDLVGQHNPLESQGPLDWIAVGILFCQTCPNGPQRQSGTALGAYKLGSTACMWVSHLNPVFFSEGCI